MKNEKKIEELEAQIQKKRDIVAYKFKDLETTQRERFLLSIGMTQDIENRMAEKNVDVEVIINDSEIVKHAQYREDRLRKEWLQESKELDDLLAEARKLTEAEREAKK